MDVNNLHELRVVELKKELEIRGLPKSGSKKDLVDRLRNVSVWMHVPVGYCRTIPTNPASSLATDLRCQ